MKSKAGGTNSMKELVLEVTKTMPDNASLEEIFDAIIVRISIERGMKDFEEGKYILHEDLLKEIENW